MKIDVLLFASLEELAGQSVISVDLEEGAKVSDLLVALEERFPNFRGRLGSLRVAIDQDFAAPSTEIPPGCELALIPPVSGGEDSHDPVQVELIESVIPVATWLERMSSADCGALATFLGVVRNEHHGREVRYLEYSAYPEMALAKMAEIGETSRSRWDIRRLGIVHRLGRLEIGEASILIAIALPHRREAFEALQYAIDTFKEIVPIWKKETFADGEAVWVEGS